MIRREEKRNTGVAEGIGSILLNFLTHCRSLEKEQNEMKHEGGGGGSLSTQDPPLPPHLGRAYSLSVHTS